jgi:hypothetical protein
MAEEDRRPEDAQQLRDQARATLQDCEERWRMFRNESSRALSSQMNRSFNYVRAVMDPDSRPSDWVRDGVALWLRAYGTGKDLYEATYKLYAPRGRRD